MRRITPRTCLWPLSGSLLASFALSIGLTFRSDHHCYAGVCGEWLFPLQARLHIIVWYFWISLSVTLLALRAFHPCLRRKLQKQLSQRQFPIIGKSLTISGVLVFLWVLALYGIIIGIWWLRLQKYFVSRGQEGGIFKGNNLVAAIALTGHFCDITMGMVLLPVARNSALASFFRLSGSTTFAFHMILAYVLFALVLLHGITYASWVAIYNENPSLSRLVFPVLNPTYLYHEVWPGSTSSLGIWRASLIFTGSITTLILLAIFFTTFPTIRRKHFNLFYFTHLFSILAVVIICLHASTVLYCTAPGLAMWVLDWGMRLYELSGKMDGNLVAVGKGWFCLTLPLPRRRLDGCACHSPLAHFHIHHTESSIREIHPFTTITYLASQKLGSSSSDESIMVQFLFRRVKSAPSSNCKSHTREKRSSEQWTSKLASLVDEETGEIHSPPILVEDSRRPSVQPHNGCQASLRLEGPYFTPANPESYNVVICLVAGTGISGAIAIAAAFSHNYQQRQRHQKYGKQQLKAEHFISATSIPPPASAPEPKPLTDQNDRKHTWKRCIVVWSVREEDYIELPFFETECTPLQLQPHITGKGHPRLDMAATISEILKGESVGTTCWVYISGPNKFVEGGVRACRECGVDFFGAKWA